MKLTRYPKSSLRIISCIYSSTSEAFCGSDISDGSLPSKDLKSSEMVLTEAFLLLHKDSYATISRNGEIILLFTLRSVIFIWFDSVSRVTRMDEESRQ